MPLVILRIKHLWNAKRRIYIYGVAEKVNC